MNHCAPPRGPQHNNHTRWLSTEPSVWLELQAGNFSNKLESLARSYILNSEESFILDTDRTIQNRVLEIKKLMLRGRKLDFGCYIFHYLCPWKDGNRASGLLIRHKICQPDLWSIRPDLHRDLPSVICIKRADWRLGILLQSALHTRECWFLDFVTSNVT